MEEKTKLTLSMDDCAEQILYLFITGLKKHEDKETRQKCMEIFRNTFE